MDYQSLLNMIEDLRRSVATPVSPQTPATSGTGLQRTYGEFSEVPQGLPKPTGTAVVPYQGGTPPYNPSTALTRTYGEFSEVPKALSGPKGSLATLAEGAGSLGGMGALSPLLAAVMGSTQGDILTNHVPKMYASNLPASPSGQVTSSPLSPVGAPAIGTPGAPSPPISQDNYSPPSAPNSGGNVPWWANANPGGYAATAPAAPSAAPAPAAPGVNPNGSIQGAMGPTSVGGAPLVNQPQNVPMPMARPASAPQAPQGMNFWQRNAAMMQDPQTGQFIDPQAAAQAQQSFPQNGSALIQKMLGYLQQKAGNSDPGNNSDPSTFGG